MGKRKTLIDESDDSGGSGSDYLDSVSFLFNFLIFDENAAH